MRMYIVIALAALALAGVDSSSYAQSECQTEEDIERINHWSPEDEISRYVGDEALLFIETIQEKELIGPSHESVFDTVVVWTLPAKNVPLLVAIAFKGGCSLSGFSLFDKNALGPAAGVIERFRHSTGRDIHKFLPPTKRLYYLAEKYRAQGKYAEAEPLYKRALATWEKSMGPFALAVNRTIDNLALLYEAQGKYDEARKFYERAISNWSTSLGTSPQEATSRENYANMLRKTGRDAEAATMEARAKAMRAGFAKNPTN